MALHNIMYAEENRVTVDTVIPDVKAKAVLPVRQAHGYLCFSIHDDNEDLQGQG